MRRKDPEARRAYQKARYHADKEKGAARIREWRAANPGKKYPEAPERAAQRQREWRIANPEKYQAIQDRATAKRAAQKPPRPERALRTPEIRAAYAKKWQLENKARAQELRREWKKENAEKVKADRKAYAAANPHKIREQRARREASKIRATPEWADVTAMRKVYEEAAFRREIVGGEWHVDHIVPLRSKLVCGLHNQFNLQVLPGDENIAKSNRHWPDMP